MSCVVSSIFRVVAATSRHSEAFRRLLAAISEAKSLHIPLKMPVVFAHSRKQRVQGDEWEIHAYSVANDDGHDDDTGEAHHNDDTDDGGSKIVNRA